MKLNQTFLALTCLGCTAIASSEVFGYGSEYYGLIVTTLIMLLYTLLVFREIAHKDDPPEEVANSIYYLGFTFTLISLLTTFYNLKTSTEGLSTLLESFAISLTTTVIGLGVRQWFILVYSEKREYFDVKQLYEEIEHCVKHSIERITDTSNKAVAEVFQNADFKSICQAVASIETTVCTSIDNLAKKAQELESSLTTSSNDLIRHHTERTDNLLSSLSALAKSSESLIEDLINKHHDLANSLRNAISDLDNKDLKQALGNHTQAIRTSTQTLTDEHQALSGCLDEHNRTLKSNSDHLIRNIDQINQFSKHLSEACDISSEYTSNMMNIKSISDDLNNLARQNVAFYKEMEKDSKFIENYREQIKLNLEESTKSLSATINVLTQYLNEIKMIATC